MYSLPHITDLNTNQFAQLGYPDLQTAILEYAEVYDMECAYDLAYFTINYINDRDMLGFFWNHLAQKDCKRMDKVWHCLPTDKFLLALKNHDKSFLKDVDLDDDN